MGERIEGLAVVDKIDRQPSAAQAEGGGNALCITVRDDIGEELFEDDEEPGPLVVGEPTIAGECLSEGHEPGKLVGHAAEDYRSPHRGLTLLLMRRDHRQVAAVSLLNAPRRRPAAAPRGSCRPLVRRRRQTACKLT